MCGDEKLVAKSSQIWELWNRSC